MAQIEYDPINQASVLDLATYISNTLLRDADVMSMAHSLEVRVPLIDHRLIEYLLSIPGPLKVRGNDPKWLLVSAAANLPTEIVNRPKRGFEFPFEYWLKNSLRHQVYELLHSNVLVGVIDSKSVHQLWLDFLAGRIKWSRIWGLYVLAIWQQNG